MSLSEKIEKQCRCSEFTEMKDNEYRVKDKEGTRHSKARMW